MIFLGMYGQVYATTGTRLLLSVPKKSVAVGEEVLLSVMVASPMQSINAVSGTITFPPNVSLGAIRTEGSVVNFWTAEPHIFANKVTFEGVILNPGYKGQQGKLFTIPLVIKKAGALTITFTEGAILANDGLGTNILETLGSTTLTAKNWETAPLAIQTDPAPSVGNQIITQTTVLPVITEYSQAVTTKTPLYLKGKGAPGALTKIVFKNIALKSVGERFIDFVQTKKSVLDEVLVTNNASGAFEYISGEGLVAGAYNATPFLVDEVTNTDRPGFGVQVLVTDSKIVRILVVAINVLALLVPIVGLAVLVYFIPWYSARRMHLLKRRIGLEEERIDLTEHKLKSQDKILEKDTENIIMSK